MLPLRSRTGGAYFSNACSSLTAFCQSLLAVSQANPIKNTTIMETINVKVDRGSYVSPSTVVMHIRPEGVLCQSGSMTIDDFIRDTESEDFLNF